MQDRFDPNGRFARMPGDAGAAFLFRLAHLVPGAINLVNHPAQTGSDLFWGAARAVDGALSDDRPAWQVAQEGYRRLRSSSSIDISRGVGEGGADLLTIVAPELRALRGGSAARIAERAAAEPTGKIYSVAYEVTLDESLWGRSDSVHFNRANADLDLTLRSDPAYAASLEELSPGIGNRVSSVGGRENPLGYTWHHAQEPGVLQLVPTYQHTPGSIFWSALHPGGRGGYAVWARPAGAPGRH